MSAAPLRSAPVAARLRHLSRAVTDALLYGNGLVAGAAAALTASSAQYWGRPLPWGVPALVLAATLFVYNLNGARRHSRRLPPTAPPRRRWIVHHRPLLLAVVLGSALVVAALYVSSPVRGLLTWLLGHLAVLSLAYSWPVLPGRDGRRWSLRVVPGLKTLLIGYVWTAVTVALPALCLELPLTSAPVLVLLARRFSFILAIALVFDLRDYTKDKLSGTRTLPGLLGFGWGRWLALACVLVSALLPLPGLSPVGQLVLAVPTLLTALVVWFADEARSDYYFSLLADGLLLVQALALVAAVAV